MDQYDGIFRVLITLAILLVGFALMRLLSRMLIKVRRITIKDKDLKGKPLNTGFEKVFFALVLVVALFFTGFTSIEAFALGFVNILPELIRLILLIVLGVLIVQLISAILEKFILYTKLEDVVTEDISKNLIPLVILAIKVILYIILLQVSISIIDIPGLETLTQFLIYPILIIIFLIIFVALLNPIRDFASSFYLRNLWAFNYGSRILFDGGSYTVKKISWLSSELENQRGDFMFVPNRVLAANGLKFQKPSHELQTLEDIKNQFVAQKPSMCGPATAQIALSMFGIHVDQDKIAKLSGAIVRENEHQVAGTHPDDLIRTVEKVSDKNVAGAWIGFDKIYNLKSEITTWLKEGALVIVDYKKKYLFPTALRAHYSLAVGMRDDEILMVDPNSKQGGVYFVDYRDVEIGMNTHSDLIKGKRGYIVLAPKGSIAFKRLQDGLLYHHPSMYHKISRKLELRLNKLTSGPGFKEMLPGFVKKYLKNTGKEQVSRVWKPN
ncbi:MAG: C39 family peptidase [Nanoarchaeota archaeon]|nr:C39 family peptidase [Nanoarchaeota archaeon]